MSDNGPEYIGSAYKKFSKEWDFEHDSSSPKYPESNGQVERTIQLVKKTLRKAFKHNDDPYLALLSTRVCSGPYNNTPPATLFYNRPIRSIVPSLNKKFNLINKKLNRELKNSKLKRNLPELNVDQKVRLHDGKSWSKRGDISGKATQPRSYFVRTENGNILRRNRKHLLPIRENKDAYHDYSDDDNYSIEDLYPIENIPIVPTPNVDVDTSNESDDEQLLDNDEQLHLGDSPTTVTRYGRAVRPPDRYGFERRRSHSIS